MNALLGGCIRCNTLIKSRLSMAKKVLEQGLNTVSIVGTDNYHNSRLEEKFLL